MENRALVIGAQGQDGSYMIELLESKGIEAFGVVRPETKPGHIKRSRNSCVNLLDKEKLETYLEIIRPSVIYNFAGVSNVFDPFSNVDEVMALNAMLPQRILDTISRTSPSTKYFQASSCLIFGNDRSCFQNEETTPNPIYPYGASKLYADNLVKMYRERGLFACSGIFFNHESPRRGAQFFTQRIVAAAKSRTLITVGNLSAVRDFGFAPDFMEAAYLMMNAEEPKDYVIGTGVLTSLEDFARRAFEFVGLDYKDYVVVDSEANRKQDTQVLRADIEKISNDLGWKPKHSVSDLIKVMMQ